MRRTRTTRAKRQFISKPKFCFYCQEKTIPDWKKPEVLRSFISERGKILSTERSGLCPKHQRRLAEAVKRARFLGLLPFLVGVR